MQITTLPTPPSDADVAAWHRTVTAAQSHDLPPGVPAQGPVETAGRLRTASVHGRSTHRVAGEFDGVASVLLSEAEGNEHTAFLDVLTVRPEARRRGVGAALWQDVRAELVASGRSAVSVMVEVDGPGEVFARAQGFEMVLPLAWYVQDVTAPSPAPQLPDGYRLVAWSGVVPDAYAESSAVAHEAMEDAPTGDVEEQAPTWTADQVRAAVQIVLDRGGRMLTVAALDAEGAMAAYTEVVLRDPADARALQYDTVVVPAHRGKGLGRAVKLRMLEEVRRAEPGVRAIGTTVADENGPMLVVNEGLGYVRERGLAVYQAKL
ncbi:GNAT family N-acetyltransferase [Streptomyces sp. NBC_01465]|uniref:GNAT family N-acetyltransferase n=1 Tax=Streptomyces sp. NBC_01465 TaxID=2903878 RepID=UPI002E368D06|nr:GNAT family N-acetyltransferase [Streptomyces sp. NBC_01465]